jgi:BlaI family transcriptional regulator, penicillinase repressor
MARRASRRSDAVPPTLHELESEVMEELWKSGESSVRGVMEALNSQTARERAYTTYMTIMARLHGKGMLVRRREGKTDFYAPVYEREEYMRLRAGAEVEELVAQFGDAALTHFAEQMASLDPARRRSLQRLARKGPTDPKG